MIDLHSHSSESDGSLSPRDLVNAALQARLEALGITDHDTFAGYQQAREYALQKGLDLVCGIELSTRLPLDKKPQGESAHLLAYFLSGVPPASFLAWIAELLDTRRERNRKMAQRLREHGMNVTLQEAEALGRTITGRPHFAQLLVKKGYAQSYRDAFDRYLDESAKCYVYREEPATADALKRVLDAGGLPSLAHPVRLKLGEKEEERVIRSLVESGLPAIEIYHADHSLVDTVRYAGIARSYGLIATGGSDFHGASKSEVRLGSGFRGNLSVPKELLERMRQSWREIRQR